MQITPNYTFFVANLQKFQLVNYVQTKVEWNRKLKKISQFSSVKSNRVRISFGQRTHFLASLLDHSFLLLLLGVFFFGGIFKLTK